MAKNKTQHPTKLSKAIADSGFKPEYVAALSDVPIGSVQGYITGAHEPKVSAAIKLARFFNLPVEDLFPPKNSENKPKTQAKMNSR